MGRRVAACAIALAVVVLLLTACGRGDGDAHGSCTTSPPDVVARADVPFGGGPAPSESEREAEVRYEATHPDVFAGAIFGDGHDYIGFTADARSHLAELRNQVPDPQRIRAYCAEHTNRELVQLQRRITADFKALSSQGINVVSINANTLTDHVDIGVTRLTPHIEQQLRDRYGDLVGKVFQTEAIVER